MFQFASQGAPTQLPPMYNTQMAKDASEFMLYAVGIHCLFAILMYGQDCVFPSEILGGSLGQSVGDANQASQSGFVAEIAPRIAKQATWMQFALLLILVSLWAIWIVLWIIGGTFGEAWKFLVVTCCPSLHGGSQEEDLAAETDWNSAKAEIEANFPPASYRMERHPDFRVFAKSLRTSSVAKPGSPALPAVPPVADVIGQAQEVNKAAPDLALVAAQSCYGPGCALWTSDKCGLAAAELASRDSGTPESCSSTRGGADVQKMLDAASYFVPGEPYEPVKIDRETLAELRPEEIYTSDFRKYSSLLPIRFFRSMIPEVAIAVCASCGNFFHQETWELEFLQNKCCPYCGSKVSSPRCFVVAVGIGLLWYSWVCYLPLYDCC
ncbi:unnamed protein product [Polarella glacialis]|uniref:Uncharacterized protein n=1 Tax=Polarella glacialis TaxID=89957 RepID=A0A813JJS8_POLGL|nr:unnamed protein product [Polarella glacialis]